MSAAKQKTNIERTQELYELLKNETDSEKNLALLEGNGGMLESRY